MRRVVPVLAALAAFAPLVSGGRLRAQAPDSAVVGVLRIQASRRDTIAAGATVTAAFSVTSAASDTLSVLPHVDAPRDWTVLMGNSAIPVAPRSAELLMLSVVVPSRAPAGVYPVRIWITSGGQGGANAGAILPALTPMDSILVLVPQRRALEIGLVERPGYTVSGKSYDAGFLLRNRGNVASTIRVFARSSLGTVTMRDTLVQLAAEESRVVRARVRTPEGLESAVDDVLEVFATEPFDTATSDKASARVTVVPEPSRKIEEYLRIPTQVSLRAASSDGVSPFEVSGRGKVRDGGSETLEFLVRGPTGAFSAFGDRDEYRAQLTASNWRARLGDNLYMLSPLTGGAQPGFGAGADATAGAFSAGAYSQEFRRSPLEGSESGAYVGARPFSGAGVAVNLVNRAGGQLPGQVGSATARLARDTYSADVEVARSRDGNGAGLARSARLSGFTDVLSYDLGHLFADTSFSGAQRGAEHNYLTASAHNWDAVSFGLNASRHRTDLSRSTGVPYLEQLDIASVSGTLLEHYTLELGTVARRTTIAGLRQSGDQRSARVRGDRDFSFGMLSLESELGQARDAFGASYLYSDVSLSARHGFGKGSGAVWAERYSGGSITKGAQGTVTIGGDASLRLGGVTNITLNGFATRLRGALQDWHSQLDMLVSRALPSGNTISLRARVIGGGSVPAADQSVAFLEYSMPMRIPVSHLRTTGRVYGRVVDAVTGQGVPGALVRLGPQVAITDGEGEVAFGGVPGGEHRVSMSQETSFANAVFVGDPTLMVDSTRTSPTNFSLAIARSARVDVAVRRFVLARTGIAGAPDSLSDAGPLANATLILAGERDTLFRRTSDRGTVSFTDVPPGAWAIMVRGDTPAFTRFDPERLQLTLAPGEVKAAEFRLVPRRREVQLIGEGQELHPTAAEPRSVAPTTVKTVKPLENEKSERRDH